MSVTGATGKAAPVFFSDEKSTQSEGNIAFV